jgi:CcmD family protein
MNKLFKKLPLLVCAMLINVVAFAQDKSSALDDAMRNNGKIYVVVAGCLIILVGLFIYVFMIDRKISRLEKDK